VVERAVFNVKPTREAILAELHIGSMVPDSDEFTKAPSAGTPDGVEAIYVRNGGAAFDVDAVFEVVVKGQTVFLRNMVSEVHLASGAKRFRNPPHFMDFVEPTTRDAIHETDALLGYLVEHGKIDCCCLAFAYMVLMFNRIP
jgi:hypothetical protein